MSPNEQGHKFKNSVEVIANLTQILSFVFSLFTAIILTAQPEPPKIPGFDFVIEYPLQAAFIICILLAYMQYVRQVIYNSREKDGLPVFDPLLLDLLFRRPLLLTPFIILFVLLYRVDFLIGEDIYYWEPGVMSFISIVIAFALLELSTLMDRVSLKSKRFKDWENDQAFKDKWIKRIRERLNSENSVHAKSFQDIGLKGVSLYTQTEWAIGMYFDQFEIEEKLSLMEEKIEKGFTGLVLRKKNAGMNSEVEDGKEK